MANTSTLLYNNTTSIPPLCIVLKFEEYIPWDNPENIVSFQTEDIMHVITFIIILPIMFLIACPANIINMIVFYKHGLKERINVCLFALSLADEIYMITSMVWYSDQLYLRLTTGEKYGSFLIFMLKNHLVGFHGFIWVSQVLSAIIASERCFCVMYPLRSQAVLETSTMVFIIIVVHVIILGLEFFQMSRYSVACAFNPFTGTIINTVIPSELYTQNEQFIDNLDIFVFGLGLPGLVLIVVIITTILTTNKLRQAAMWRASTSSNNSVSERDIALTRMLVANSVFFIICIIPFIAFRFVYLFMPEANTGGLKHNFYILTQEILLIISYINSTFNFAIYYTMGSRYKQTFWQLFECNSRKNAKKPITK